jgi:Ni/Co efflux regulator RcnB
MKYSSLQMSLALVFMLTAILAAGPVLADKPSWAGGDNGEKYKSKETRERYEGRGDLDRKEFYGNNRFESKGYRCFTDRQRIRIREHYSDQYRRKGCCPPRFANKHKGCIPCGQAKKWVIGQPLPRHVIFYDLPPGVLVQLGPPPSRHRFVRVAQDILLIAVGTGMVVDAVDNMSWEFGY